MKIQIKNAVVPVTGIACLFACVVGAPIARAVSPAPDGGYPNNNTAEGDGALFNLTPNGGFHNTALGFAALYSVTNGGGNTGVGSEALLNDTDGVNNSAFGSSALNDNSTGSSNTAIGWMAMLHNLTGYQNTAVGSEVMTWNSTGYFNTAIGLGALHENRDGNNNTATSKFALYNNVHGSDNTANGCQALYNTNSSANTATGKDALYSNLIGSSNTADGYGALYKTTGSFNIALGYNAGSSLTNGSNNIDIGAVGIAGESTTIRIGKAGTQHAAFIQGISGAPVANGVTVLVNPAGKLGTVIPSSGRFKEEIKPMDKSSEALLSLKPVTFKYKHDLDPEGIPQFGLVAEEVEKVNPYLVVRDAEGKVYTVRYDAVNAMLLNEFLKEHQQVLEQQKKIATLETAIVQEGATNAEQQKQIEVLTSGLQKVNARMELHAPAPQVTANDN